MTVPGLVLAGGLTAAALTVAAPASATSECRGLDVCVAVAGPWVVVPGAPAVPRVRAPYQLRCPRGFVVGGTDAELSDEAIDVAFLGAPGSPVSPGVTTSRTIVFVGAYTGTSARAPSFRPHIGCIPTMGGGRRTPTGVSAVTPPGMPTVRRVVTARIHGLRRIVASCRANEHLVDWYATRAFATSNPPTEPLVASLSMSARVADQAAIAVARARRGQGIVQVAAVCAGER